MVLVCGREISSLEGSSLLTPNRVQRQEDGPAYTLPAPPHRAAGCTAKGRVAWSVLAGAFRDPGRACGPAACPVLAVRGPVSGPI